MKDTNQESKYNDADIERVTGCGCLIICGLIACILMMCLAGVITAVVMNLK